MAVEKDAFIITEDKDFGDEIVYYKIAHKGALLLRLAGVNIETKIHLVLNTIKKHSGELSNCFSVLS